MHNDTVIEEPRGRCGPWHTDEQLYSPELCLSLCAYSQLNQWANQSMLGHTQAIAKPLSGHSSLTLTPAQVAGDTLIHLRWPRQTHLIQLSLPLSHPSGSLNSPLSSLLCFTQFHLCTHLFPLCCYPCLTLSTPRAELANFAYPRRGCLLVWPQETELWSNWHTHHCLSISALNEGWNDWELELSFDTPPPPSASGSSIWLQRASVELHKCVWKYLSIHNSHMEVKSFDARHLRVITGKNKCRYGSLTVDASFDHRRKMKSFLRVILKDRWGL